jgi:hypothetical protein
LDRLLEWERGSMGGRDVACLLAGRCDGAGSLGNLSPLAAHAFFLAVRTMVAGLPETAGRVVSDLTVFTAPAGPFRPFGDNTFVGRAATS